MIFQSKLDRAMDWLKHQYKNNDKDNEKYHSDQWYVKAEINSESNSSIDLVNELEEDVLSSEEIKESDFEKHDFSALLISAFMVFMPFTVLILGIFVLLAWVIF